MHPSPAPGLPGRCDRADHDGTLEPAANQADGRAKRLGHGLALDAVPDSLPARQRRGECLHCDAEPAQGRPGPRDPVAGPLRGPGEHFFTGLPQPLALRPGETHVVAERGHRPADVQVHAGRE